MCFEQQLVVSSNQGQEQCETAGHIEELMTQSSFNKLFDENSESNSCFL